MITLTLVGDTALIARLNAMPNKVRDSVVRETYKLALLLELRIKTQKLSGQVLNKRSGRLQQSIQSKVEQTPTSIIGKAFSAGDVKYAAIHERGGFIPAHVIEARNARVLAFSAGGSTVFARRVNHPGSKMPERSFMRSSLADMRAAISEGLKQAVFDGVKK